MRLGGVQHQTIGAGAGGNQAIQPPILMQPVNPAGGVLQARLPLIGEQDRFIHVQREVVQAFEAFAHHRLDDGGGGAGGGVYAHQAVPVVRGDQHAVGLNLKAVGPAGVLCQLLPMIPLDAEDAAVGDVDHQQPAERIEARAFQEAVHRHARSVGVGPFRALGGAAEMGGDGGGNTGLDKLGRGEEHAGESAATWGEMARWTIGQRMPRGSTGIGQPESLRRHDAASTPWIRRPSTSACRCSPGRIFVPQRAP